jgi:transcriptional regulator with XRE-family HTH domain
MTTSPPRDIPAEIRAEMGRQRLTMLSLSEQTGIPRTTLAEQVNGGSRITVDNLVRIAKALGVEPSTFIDNAAV